MSFTAKWKLDISVSLANSGFSYKISTNLALKLFTKFYLFSTLTKNGIFFSPSLVSIRSSRSTFSQSFSPF